MNSKERPFGAALCPNYSLSVRLSPESTRGLTKNPEAQFFCRIPHPKHFFRRPAAYSKIIILFT